MLLPCYLDTSACCTAPCSHAALHLHEQQQQQQQQQQREWIYITARTGSAAQHLHSSLQWPQKKALFCNIAQTSMDGLPAATWELP
jgi:hypothetical protein